MIIMNGKEIQEQIKKELKTEIFVKNHKPSVAIIQIGDRQDSNAYVKQKIQHGEEVGITTSHFKLDENVKEESIIELIKILNKNDKINGIIVQLPLGNKDLDEHKIINTIDPIKDIDCLTETNVGKLYLQKPLYKPCTPSGVIEILKRYDVDLVGKKVLMIGRSNIVGRPMGELLLQENAIPTITHSYDKSIKERLFDYDIIISAVGKSNFITVDDVKYDEYITRYIDKEKMKKLIILDVGINRDENGKMIGDCSKELYNNDLCRISNISPVPKGIGAMTVSMFLSNILKAYKIQNNLI